MLRDQVLAASCQDDQDPDCILEILIVQYSCPMSFIAVKEAFYARKQ